MKIISKESNSFNPQTTIHWELKDSVCKTHFKELMKLSVGYDWKTKTGEIPSCKVDQFRKLEEKINKSSSKTARNSHAQTVAKSKNKNNKNSNAIDFQEFCEDFLDQDPGLMGEKQREEAYAQYKKVLAND